MTIPLWTPFALLTAVCAVFPSPTWVRRVDWLVVGICAFCLCFWGGISLLIWWVA